MKREEEKKKKLRARLYGFAAAVQEGALEHQESYEFWLERIYDLFPHWISVEDELPTCNVFVLTCEGQGNTNLLMLAGNGGWYDHSVAKHRNITHWMPLPAPPEHIADVSKKKTACPDCIVAEFPGCDLDIPCCKCDEQCNSRQPCPKKGE